MQSIFEKDHIIFSDSGGTISNVSAIYFASSTTPCQLTSQTFKDLNPTETSFLNKINASDIEIHNNLFVAGHTGMGSLSTYQTTNMLGDLNIGTQERGYDIHLQGNSAIYFSDSFKLDSEYLSQIKTAIETPEIKITDNQIRCDNSQHIQISVNF